MGLPYRAWSSDRQFWKWAALLPSGGYTHRGKGLSEFFVLFFLIQKFYDRSELQAWAWCGPPQTPECWGYRCESPDWLQQSLNIW